MSSWHLGENWTFKRRFSHVIGHKDKMILLEQFYMVATSAIFTTSFECRRPVRFLLRIVPIIFCQHSEKHVRIVEL
jgi:hypothetical protein